MKKSTSTVTALLLAVTLCAGAFMAVGILFLPATLYSAPTPAGETVSNIRYSSDPQSSGLLFLLEDGSGALFFLDFEQEVVFVKLFEEDAAQQGVEAGYEVNYTVRTDLDFIGRFCDRLGGIVMEKDGFSLRYSSAGLLEEILAQNDPETAVKICEAFFEKIARTGLSSGDFKFIIENTDTDLNYPTCYSWIERLPALFSRYVFLDS